MTVRDIYSTASLAVERHGSAFPAPMWDRMPDDERRKWVRGYVARAEVRCRRQRQSFHDAAATFRRVTDPEWRECMRDAMQSHRAQHRKAVASLRIARDYAARFEASLADPEPMAIAAE